MSKRPTEKSSHNNPNAVLKYAGMVFQILVVLGIAVYFGQKLDARFSLEKPYMTALLAILALPLVLYSILKDIL